MVFQHHWRIPVIQAYKEHWRKIASWTNSSVSCLHCCSSQGLAQPARPRLHSSLPSPHSPAAVCPFLGCFGAVYWKNSFPWLETVWSSPKREANLALEAKNELNLPYWLGFIGKDHQQLGVTSNTKRLPTLRHKEDATRQAAPLQPLRFGKKQNSQTEAA